jgi:hypothetical protein
LLLNSPLIRLSNILPDSNIIAVSNAPSNSVPFPLSSTFAETDLFNTTDYFRPSIGTFCSNSIASSASVLQLSASGLRPASPLQTVPKTQSADPDAGSYSELASSHPFTRPGEKQDERSPTPSGTPNNLGLILGIVFAILILIALVLGFIVYKLRSRKDETGPPEDPNREFYWLQQREHENEMSAEFTNPVFDEQTRVGDDSGEFTPSPDEMI